MCLILTSHSLVIKWAARYVHPSVVSGMHLASLKRCVTLAFVSWNKDGRTVNMTKIWPWQNCVFEPPKYLVVDNRLSPEVFSHEFTDLVISSDFRLFLGSGAFRGFLSLAKSFSSLSFVVVIGAYMASHVWCISCIVADSHPVIFANTFDLSVSFFVSILSWNRESEMLPRISFKSGWRICDLAIFSTGLSQCSSCTHKMAWVRHCDEYNHALCCPNKLIPI